MTWGPIGGGGGGGTSSATYTVTDALIVGAATTSGVRLDLESGVLAVREGDDSGGGSLFAYDLSASNALRLCSSSAMTNPLAICAAYGWSLRNDIQYQWSSTSNDANATRDTGLARDSAGQVKVTDGSTGVGNLRATALIVGTADTSGVRLDLESGVLAVREGDDSAYAPLTAGVLKANSYLTIGADTGLERPTTNILQVTSGTGVSNTVCLVYRRRVVASTGDTSLSGSYSNMLSTNEGAAGAVNLSLPAAVAAPLGDMFYGVVQANQYLRFTAATGDTIRDGATVSAAAGYIRSTTVGSTICLQAINATEWVVMYKTGTWTVDS